MTLKLLDIPLIFGLSVEVYIICLLILVATFFIGRRLLKNFITTKRTRRITALTIAVVATPIIYLGLIRLLMFWITYTPSKDFDKSQWLTDKESRYQMANDIIDSKILISKDTNQLKQNLGDPSWKSDTNKAWTYDMGFGGGGLGFLFHHLNIKFDIDWKVISVEHFEIRD